MKAIKLASVFAVSAVAAAVSTATFAAEPVFSGQAGISYTSYDKYSEVNQVGKGELDLTVDTGVVVTSVEFRENDTKLLAAYVKQGAVSFGDFDGSISDDAWTIGDDIVDVKSTPSGSAGIRYAVMPNLTVALEATAADSTAGAEKDSDIGVAAKYSQDLGMATVSASAGSVGDYMSYTVGASADVASGVTLAASFGSYTDGSGAKDATRIASGVSVSVAASDALTLTAVYGMFDNEDATGAKYDSSATYLNVSYKVGDVTYYVENSAGDDYTKFAKSEVKATTIGAKASF